MPAPQVRRINLFLNSRPCAEGRWICHPVHINPTDSLEQVLVLASSRLHCTASRLLFGNGTEITDLAMVREGDKVFVSEGEDFIARGTVDGTLLCSTYC